ncbi:hypothetical protein CR513_40165, partial [Mucuna pruriens]
MVNSNVKSFWFLAMCVLSLCHDLKMVAAENCDEDMRGLEIECLFYMNNSDPKLVDPNQRCCNIIKGVNVPCCCSSILQRKLVFPPGHVVADILDWTKVMHCFNYCGRPFPAGYKCGNFVVPSRPAL